MQINRRHLILAGMASTLAWPARAAAGEALIAVATNFISVAERLKPDFEAGTGHSLTLSSGSTGQLYGQITNGAPYDALLAADQARPALLQNSGLGHGQISYARGLLALWRPESPLNEASLRGDFAHLAIANPALAPYGLAARQALEALGLWESLQGRLVLGQNVGQAFALVASGNAELGLVAQSYAQAGGESWPVPEALYAPILQDAVLLGENPAAAAFLDYLRSPAAQAVIKAAGYGAL